jgi:hypothetical protein
MVCKTEPEPKGLAQSGLDDRDILAKTVEEPDAPLAGVRREIRAVDSNLEVAETGLLKTLLNPWRREVGLRLASSLTPGVAFKKARDSRTSSHALGSGISAPHADSC